MMPLPSPDPSEQEAKVKESVEKAKEAVGLDVTDGTSWSIATLVSPPSPLAPPLSFLPFSFFLHTVKPHYEFQGTTKMCSY